MTQTLKKKFNSDIERKEKSFDEYYNETIVTNEKMKIVDIAYEKIKHKYEGYDQTEAFIEYLRSVEKVFAQAETDKWSVEKTQDEMIRGEIYIISQTTGIDEEIFNKIYEEFQEVSGDVEKIHDVANKLIEKYSNIKDCFECEDCRNFIVYVKEALFVFSKTMDGDENFDELSEVKMQLIRIQMKQMAIDDRPPIEILQDIYDDFVGALKK